MSMAAKILVLSMKKGNMVIQTGEPQIVTEISSIRKKSERRMRNVWMTMAALKKIVSSEKR